MDDVYARMASKVFNKPYEECLEYKNNKRQEDEGK